MVNIVAGQLGTHAPLKMLRDWTDRIAEGELPPRSRSGRRASSATSSSRCGTGATESTTCTT